MEGMTTKRIQQFQYDPNDLSKILIDGYPAYSIDKVNELIRYEFDLQFSIRLDILLQSADLYKLRGGQALVIMNSIINHCIHIQTNGSTHKNLTSDKVWLVMNGYEPLKIVFSDLVNFKIHFTGYGDGEESVGYDPNFICKQVLIDMLKCFNKFQSSDNKQEVYGVSLQTIKGNLLHKLEIKNYSMQEIQNEICKTLSTYQYTFKSQILQGIDSVQYGYNFKIFQLTTLSRRHDFRSLIQAYLKTMQNQYQLDQSELQNTNETSLYWMIQWLNFDDNFLNVFQREFLAFLRKQQDKPSLKLNYPYSKIQIQEITKFYFNQLKQKYSVIVEQMDNVIKQDFKIQSLLEDTELNAIINKNLNRIALQACNSITEFEKYKSKKYQFNSRFHNSLIEQIRQAHKRGFIAMVDKLVESLL